jgi:3-phosphoshikimate 1-carboxyvinyltransferase
MPDIALHPPPGPFDADFQPPGSKSLTNRALVLAAMADGVCELSNVLFADDTLVMIDSLMRLGFHLEIDRPQQRIHVYGRAGHINAASADLFCGLSGTTIRFLTALCTLGKGMYRLDGTARMRQRPIGQLVDLLRHLGARIQYDMESGFAPLTVLADGLPGGTARYPAAQSSQFLSAVLQVCPYARHEVQIDLDSPQTSWPYVAMTMRLMDQFGLTPELERDPKTHQPRRIIIPRGHYRPTIYNVEPDASNASYFLAAAALLPGSRLTISGLGSASLQGDVGFAQLLARMGATVDIHSDSISVRGPQRLSALDEDLSAMPDMAQTLAVLAVFAEGITHLRGLHTLRVKETDRLSALVNELQKLGATALVDGDQLVITPPASPRAAAIDTYDDHRMAMSFAVAACRVDGLSIRDAQCVNKTFPTFFEDLARVTRLRTGP